MPDKNQESPQELRNRAEEQSSHDKATSSKPLSPGETEHLFGLFNKLDSRSEGEEF